MNDCCREAVRVAVEKERKLWRGILAARSEGAAPRATPKCKECGEPSVALLHTNSTGRFDHEFHAFKWEAMPAAEEESGPCCADHFAPPLESLPFKCVPCGMSWKEENDYAEHLQRAHKTDWFSQSTPPETGGKRRQPFDLLQEDQCAEAGEEREG